MTPFKVLVMSFCGRSVTDHRMAPFRAAIASGYAQPDTIFAIASDLEQAMVTDALGDFNLAASNVLLKSLDSPCRLDSSERRHRQDSSFPRDARAGSRPGCTA
jgi:hypothetical protein